MLLGEILQDEYVYFVTCLDSFGVKEAGGTVVCVAMFIPRIEANAKGCVILCDLFFFFFGILNMF